MKTIIRKPEMNNMNQLFDTFFRDEPLHWSQQLNQFRKNPAVNISENENTFSLELLVPGFEKDQINIEFDKGLITLSAELENKDNETSTTKFHRKEFIKQSFKRSFQFKEGQIDEENIQASFHNGILHLELPKKSQEEINTKRRIEIA
jgi:HSP20 family protein